MKNKHLRILIILGTLTFLSLIYGLSTRAPTQKQLPAPIAEQQLLGHERIVLSQRHFSKTNFTAWGRNPFVLNMKNFTGSTLVLNGVIWDDQKPMAIVNDNVVGVGDHVGANTVIDIQQDRVMLSDGTNNVELKWERKNSE